MNAVAQNLVETYATIAHGSRVDAVLITDSADGAYTDSQGVLRERANSTVIGRFRYTMARPKVALPYEDTPGDNGFIPARPHTAIMRIDSIRHRLTWEESA